MPVADVVTAVTLLAEDCDRGVIEVFGHVGNEECIRRVGYGSEFRGLWTGYRWRKTLQDVLIHRIADLPRVASSGIIPVLPPMILQKPGRAPENTLRKIAVRSGCAGAESRAFDVINDQRLVVVLVRVVIGGVIPPGKRQLIVVVIDIQEGGQALLFHVGPAQSRLCLAFGFAQGGQEHARQDRDDGDHD